MGMIISCLAWRTFPWLASISVSDAELLISPLISCRRTTFLFAFGQVFVGLVLEEVLV